MQTPVEVVLTQQLKGDDAGWILPLPTHNIIHEIKMTINFEIIHEIFIPVMLTDFGVAAGLLNGSPFFSTT